jgi:hypothetical protein
MNWRPTPATANAQVSEDGRYSVCRIAIRDRVMFEAWRTRSHVDGPHCVSTNLPTSQAARDAAEEDDRD